MKKYIHFWILIGLFGLAGCDLADKAVEEYEKVEEKVTETYETIKHEYDEYREYQDDQTSIADKPFTVVYQKDESRKSMLISSYCSNNNAIKYTYYETQNDAHNNFLRDIKDLISYPGESGQKPFWDIRYVNQVSRYINGGNYDQYPDHSEYTGLDVRSGINNIGIGTDFSQSEAAGGVAQSECIDGVLTGGTTINLNDAPEQNLIYAGPQSTFTYMLGESLLASPWKAEGKGNLIIQGSFDKPLYIATEEDIGGGVYFNLFIKNKSNGKRLNFVIGIYAAGTAWQREKRGIKYDTTTNTVHIATVIKDSSWWSTKSPSSLSIQEAYPGENKRTGDDNRWDEFYRVNISYQNLLAVLNELAANPPDGAENENYGSRPQDWEVTAIMIQYELVMDGGEAVLSGSFKGFEAYTSDDPL